MSGCLLLTRQPAENQRLAARLAAHGVRTCSLPLLTLEPCAEGPAERLERLDGTGTGLDPEPSEARCRAPDLRHTHARTDPSFAS